MYLKKRKFIGNGKVKITDLEYEFRRNKVGNEFSDVEEIVQRAGYWRKANAIHKWFVDNVQDGIDDCKEYYVEEEKLKELLDVCNKVKENHSLAKELLPTQSGFFFGDTEYNDWYFNDIDLTIEILEKQIKDADEYDFYYQSSW